MGHAVTTPDDATRRRVLISSTVGSAIEWYDFYLYSTAASLVLGPLFLPSDSETVSTLAAFATYAVGFVARPVGGVVIGHFGDRIGRKSMLVLTLLTMGIATTCIGLLPTYEQIGVWAPILLVLLRVVQGFGVGGEWGGAILLAHEYSPPGRANFYASWPQIGFPAGLLAGTLAFAALAHLPDDQFLSWGWRLPFLASAVLVVVGLVIRLRLSETPEFAALRQAAATARQPLVEALRRCPRAMTVGTLSSLGHGVIVTTYTVYLLKEFSGDDGQFKGIALNGMMLGAALQCLVVPIAGALADRYGSRRVLTVGYLLGSLAIVPALTVADGGASQLGVAVTFLLAMGLGHGAAYGALSGYLASTFPTSVRYTAISATYQLGGTLSSFGPLLTAALVASTSAEWPLVALLVIPTAVAALAINTVRLTPATGETTATTRPVHQRTPAEGAAR